METLKRQVNEAAKFADMDQLGVAPQCGFASTEEGNNVTFDDQRQWSWWLRWRKISGEGVTTNSNDLKTGNDAVPPQSYTCKSL